MQIDLADEINIALKDYTDDVIKATNEAIEEVASEAVDELKSAGGFKDITGKYRKGWTKKKDGGSLGTENMVVYNKVHQLTHLLEKGHAKRGGNGRVRAFPHIAPVEEELPDKFQRKLEGKLQ